MVEISARADLAVAVSEDGEGYAVMECGVNGGGVTAKDVRAGNGVQPEMVRTAATLLTLSNGAGTFGRGRRRSRSQPQRKG